MNANEIVRALRNCGGGPEGMKITHDAADLIESLQAELNKTRLERNAQEANKNYYKAQFDERDRVTKSQTDTIVQQHTMILGLQAVVKQLQESQRWIPVSERSPEHEAYILIFSPGNKKETPEIKASRGFMVRLKNTDVTHWRPMPEPPEEGAEK